MNFKLRICVLLNVSFLSLVDAKEYKNKYWGEPRTTVYKNNDSACGGVLEINKYSDNFLSYKMDHPVARYESCIWTIYSPKKSTIKINVTEPLYFFKLQSLSVGYFKDSKYDDLSALTWIYVKYSTNTQHLEVPGPVAFIYYTAQYDEPKFGFQLTFEGVGEELKSSYIFRNYFREGVYGRFSYIVDDPEYRQNLRVTLVVKTYPGTLAKDMPDPSRIHTISKGTEGCDKYIISMYGYGVGEREWSRNCTISCNSKPQWCSNIILAHANFPVIITFMSNSVGAKHGFDIRWMSNYYW